MEDFGVSREMSEVKKCHAVLFGLLQEKGSNTGRGKFVSGYNHRWE